MIERWVGQRLGDYITASGGDDIRANCPFCLARHGLEDTKMHLYISLSKPVAHCFRCEWKGNYISLIMSVDGCNYSTALLSIDNPPSDISRFDELHSPRGLVQGGSHSKVPDGFKSLYMKGIRSHLDDQPLELQAVGKYIRHRLYDTHFNKDSVLESRFGYVPGSNRAWILIDTEWWQGRLIINGKPKYLSPPWPIGDSLWNASALKKYLDIVICEGVFSACHVGKNAVALCSKNMTDLQAKRIIDADLRTVTIMLDSDAAIQSHTVADKLLQLGYAGELKIHYLYNGDPADSLDGDTAIYGWEEKARFVLSAV